jgi:hypothetical protein
MAPGELPGGRRLGISVPVPLEVAAVSRESDIIG